MSGYEYTWRLEEVDESGQAELLCECDEFAPCWAAWKAIEDSDPEQHLLYLIREDDDGCDMAFFELEDETMAYFWADTEEPIADRFLREIQDVID